MNIICAPSGIMGIVHPAQGIQDMTKAGFENILLDLSSFCPPGDLETLESLEKWREKQKGTGKARLPFLFMPSNERCAAVAALLSRYHAAGLHTPAARAPWLWPDTKRTDQSGLLLSLTQESLLLCGEAGCETLIVKPLFSGLLREEEWAANREFYLSLLPAARENHVTILLENQCRDHDGHLIRGICSDSGEAAAWVDWLNEEAGEERFGFCMNVGTCSLCGQNMQDFARTLGSRIKAVILRDGNGQKEMSALPFTCTSHGQPQTDWLSLIRGLREIGFDGQLILDFVDTAKAFSPLLRPQLLQLAQATAEYFRWQIEMENVLRQHRRIVLFGAGNMCRNYMKCYGEKYPPMFTCDNNERLWGTEFCGLTVRPPESLKELPKDCVIFICNIYYREIEKQLKSMGIQNRIAFFNDEYMPSFYYDRLEGR
ncbi:MAG: sugar phosphate isomerase/epimerase [Lachnospiraceae bacterium]|jgi:sugar phosphate isomerase/epimerase|nr:sugar phosphate isomerase/epimerase [Lachnospiraceae bacterium]